MHSLKAYEWLKSHEHLCDVIHFHDVYGIGYFTALAKYEGLHFLDKIIQISTQTYCDIITNLFLDLFGPKFYTRQAANKYDNKRIFF